MSRGYVQQETEVLERSFSGEGAVGRQFSDEDRDGFAHLLDDLSPGRDS